MKIKFDGNQDFQLDAIRAVVDVFAGQPLTRATLQWQSDALGGELLTEMGVGNSLALGDEAILRNVRAIQTANEIEPNAELQGLNFSVEMETGSIYDVVEYESKVEYESAKALDARKDIKLFFKLPDWFKVETPLGTYNPDWAIVKEAQDGGNKLYLVRETKGTTQFLKLPEIQRRKIKCGEAHFKAVGLNPGGYAWVQSANEV